MTKAKRSNAHQRTQRKLAGIKGKTEVPISRNRRLDVKTAIKATEVERSGQPARLKAALSRLGTQKGVGRELRVPQKDMDKATDLAKASRLKKVTISNIGGTRRRQV